MRHFEDVSFGQVGAAFQSATGPVPKLDEKVVVAITAMEDVTFTTLTPEDPDLCFSVATGAGGLGDSFNATLKAGVTIYGRWTAVTLKGGKAVLYYAY